MADLVRMEYLGIFKPYYAQPKQVPYLLSIGWLVDDDYELPPTPGNQSVTHDELDAALADLEGADFLSGVRFVADGDSMTAANNASSSASWGDSWATHLALASGGAIRMTWNAGHGGYTSDQLSALLEDEVFVHQPTLIGLLPGRNDTLDANGYPAATKAFLDAVLSKARVTGAGVFLVNQPPQGTASITAPTTVTATAVATGGTLAAATYRYVVTSRNGAASGSGETPVSAVASVTVTSGTTNSVRLTWTHVEGATGYRVYKETAPGSGAYGLITTITTSGQGFASKFVVDTGATTPGAAPPSTNTTAVAAVPAVHSVIAALNNWLPRYAAANGLPLVDIYEDLVDPLTGMYQTGYTQDGTHPTTTRQKYMGVKVWNTIKNMIKPLPSVTARSNVDPRNLLSNGLLVNGTSLPTSWGQYGGTGSNYTTALAAKAGFKGRALTATLTAPDARYFTSNYVTTGWSIGDRVLVAFRLQTEGCEAGGAAANFFIACSGATPDRVTGLILSGVDISPGVWTTEFVVPTGTTQFGLQGPFMERGSGSASVGEVTFVNLTSGQIIGG